MSVAGSVLERETLRGAVWLWALWAILLGLMILSLLMGRYPVPLGEVLHIVLTTWPFGASGDPGDAGWVAVELVRLPRILAVTLSGIGLALAGTAMQGLLRNPLVGPDTCGVSTGAAFGIVLGILLSLPPWGSLCLGFLFGLMALPAAFVLSRPLGSGGVLALVLAGFIVESFFGSAVGLVQYLADPQHRLPTITYWLLGSFADVGFEKTGVLAAATTLAGSLLLALRWRINLLSLGETDARSLGVNVGLLRWAIVVLVALIVAAQSSVSGGITWVGLIIPHVGRMLVGPDHARLLPVSALLGGIYLLAMDDLARSVGADEIPIGVLTTFIGAPIFGALLWKQQAKGWSHE